MDVGGTLSPGVFRRKATATRSGNSHEMRIVAHEMRQAWRLIGDSRHPEARAERASKDESARMSTWARRPSRRRFAAPQGDGDRESGVAPSEAEPGLDLGDLGPTHGHQMRRR